MKSIKYIISCIIGCFDALVGKGMNGGIILIFFVAYRFLDKKVNLDFKINILYCIKIQYFCQVI